MERRAFGKTGLTVSVPGFGAGSVGDPSLPEKEAEQILLSVIDSGINLIDSARSYGSSEERIGKFLKNRRQEVVLSTKVGYGIPGYQDWTGPCITAGIDHALKLFQTDVIDIVHLHSCPLSVLQNGEVIEALQRAATNGKVRVCAYSGDNDPFDWSLQSTKFGGLQTSVSVCDQRAIQTLSDAEASGIGIIAKRPLANVPWGYVDEPSHDAVVATYWKRWRRMNLEALCRQAGLTPAELAIRFVAHLPGVSTIIIGSRNPEHMVQNVEMLKRGPLPEEMIAAIRAAFQQNDEDWIGQI